MGFRNDQKKIKHYVCSQFDNINLINMHSFSLFLAFFKLWNTHLHLTPCYGDSHLGQILENFIDQYGLKIHRDNLYGNFVLHLSNLSNFDAISSSFMLEMINRYQVIFLARVPDRVPELGHSVLGLRVLELLYPCPSVRSFVTPQTSIYITYLHN